jgi:hypothetical protein
MYDCYCDYEMPEFHSRRDVKSCREGFQCEECSRSVPPGEPYEYVSGRWGGFMSSFKTCQRCVDLRQWVQNNVPCFCWAHSKPWALWRCVDRDGRRRGRSWPVCPCYVLRKGERDFGDAGAGGFAGARLAGHRRQAIRRLWSTIEPACAHWRFDVPINALGLK